MADFIDESNVFENISGYEWVGWQNKTDDPRRRLELNFEFDAVRNFSHIDIHTNNDFEKSIQVLKYMFNQITLKQQRSAPYK